MRWLNRDPIEEKNQEAVFAGNRHVGRIKKGYKDPESLMESDMVLNKSWASGRSHEDANVRVYGGDLIEPDL